jgi:hypothetical protein
MLKQILNRDKYPIDTHAFIIELMKKFELCYYISQNKVLIPDLLEKREPKLNISGEAVTVILKYKFLPRSIIPRFIVRMHREIHSNLVWRSGVVLKNRDFTDTKAIVIYDEEDETIKISVYGKDRRGYLHRIIQVFRDIHSTFAKITCDERIPLPDEPHLDIGYRHLLDLLKRGKIDVSPEHAGKDYNIHELLGDVYNQKDMDAIVKESRERKGSITNITHNYNASSITGAGEGHKIQDNEIQQQNTYASTADNLSLIGLANALASQLEMDDLEIIAFEIFEDHAINIEISKPKDFAKKLVLEARKRSSIPALLNAARKLYPNFQC